MRRSFWAEAAAFLFAIAVGAVIVEQFIEAIVLESQLRGGGVTVITLPEFLDAANKLDFVDKPDFLGDAEWAAVGPPPVRLVAAMVVDGKDGGL